MYNPTDPTTSPGADAPLPAEGDVSAPAEHDDTATLSAADPAPGDVDQEQSVEAGELVTFTYQDAAGNDVVRTGIVTRLTDAHDPGNGEGAVVAWLGDFSDPIPLDQLERIDG